MQKSLASKNWFWLVKSNLSLAAWLPSWKVSLEPWATFSYDVEDGFTFKSVDEILTCVH